MTPENQEPPDTDQKDAALGFVQADAPIEHRVQDLFDRVRLSDAIADQVTHGPRGQGLVIGVAGPWGSGKTSILQMVEEAVREHSETVIVSFNPWLYSSADELVLRFLAELGAQLRERSGSGVRSDALKKVGDQLATYAQAVEPLGWVPAVGPWAARLGGLGRAYGAARRRSADVSAEGQRTLVREQLAALEHRVLVVIDDLDRLEPDQIRDMMRLIKLVGDFPNTTYLVAYDPKPVQAAVDGPGRDGHTYLEKIVQVVHDIPDPPRDALLRMLTSELDAIIDDIPTGPFWPEDWQNVFPEGINPFFKTARDVRRYLNAVPVTLRTIGREVAVVDVLALEAVRVFAPSAYAEMALSVPVLAAGERQMGVSSAPFDALAERRMQAILAAAGPSEDPIKEIVRRLFPGVGHLVGGTRLSGHQREARRRLRVADADIFRTYLGRALPAGVVSGALVGEVVDALSSRERLNTILEGLDPEVAEGVIQRLEDYENEFPLDAVQPSIPPLLNQMPRLREGRRGMFDLGPDLVVGRVVLRLLRRIDDPSKCSEMVDEMLPAIDTLSARMQLLDRIGHRENVGHRLVSEADAARFYAELEDEVMAAGPGQLSAEHNLFELFLRVAQDRGDAATAWMNAAIADDAVLLRLLRSQLREQSSQTVGDYAVRSRMGLPWTLFEGWFGGDQLRTRVESLVARAETLQMDERTAQALETARAYAAGEISDATEP